MKTSLYENEYRIWGLKRTGKSTCLSILFDVIYDKKLCCLKNTNFSFVPRTYMRRGKKFRFEKIIQKNIINDVFNIANVIEHFSIKEIKNKSEDHFYPYTTECFRYSKMFGKKKFSENVINIIVIRNFYDMAANILQKRNGLCSDLLQRLSEYWIDYVKEVAGETNHIKNKIIFNFDNWIDSETYHNEFCSKLKIDYSKTDWYIKKIKTMDMQYCKNYYTRWKESLLFKELIKRDMRINEYIAKFDGKDI